MTTANDHSNINQYLENESEKNSILKQEGNKMINNHIVNLDTLKSEKNLFIFKKHLQQNLLNSLPSEKARLHIQIWDLGFPYIGLSIKAFLRKKLKTETIAINKDYRIKVETSFSAKVTRLQQKCIDYIAQKNTDHTFNKQELFDIWLKHRNQINDFINQDILKIRQ